MRSRVIAGLPGGFDPENIRFDRTIPRVIRVSDPEDDDISLAWRELAPAYAWNLEQPLASQSPDPFFARAQIWTAVGSHTDALSDFLRAASLVRKQDEGDFLKYAHNFTVLEAALNREDALPGNVFVNEARTYWENGHNQYRIRRFDLAVFDYTDAVRLDPSDPSYWYSRALAHKALNMNDRAEQDARIGVTAERRLIDRSGLSSTVYINKRLSMIQGRRRAWLERLRTGDGIAWGRYQ